MFFNKQDYFDKIMGATLYGARLWQSPDNTPYNLRYDIIGNNSEAFAANDIVSINSTNELVVSTAKIVGVVVKSQTMDSDNETVDKTCPGFIPIHHEQVWLMGTNSDLTDNATDVGKYYMITGATGAQQVDVDSGNSTTLTEVNVGIVKVDPYNEGGSGSGSGLRKCLVRFLHTIYQTFDPKDL